MKHALAAIVAALTLAACAGAGTGERPEARPGADNCVGEPAQRFVDERATEEVGAQILAATGASRLRWVPPRTAVTMDYRHDRVTVSYDDDYRILRVSCG